MRPRRCCCRHVQKRQYEELCLPLHAADVVIIGAGAAGLMCAIEAGNRGRSVIVLERNDAVGKKIRISGGGRCNFTNLYTSPENFISENKNFHKSALARYTPDDFIALIRRHRIAYHEKKLGQLFCDGSSQQVIDMLKAECAGVKARIVLNCRVESIDKRERFVLKTSLEDFECSSLVLDGPEMKPFRDLHGVSLDAIVRCDRVEFRENLLFTHRGISGPAILQISTYWQPGIELTLDFLPDDREPKTLPRRFVQVWNS